MESLVSPRICWIGEAEGPYPRTISSFCTLGFVGRFLLEEVPSTPLGPIVTGVKVMDEPIVPVPSAGFGFFDLLGGGYGSPLAAYSAALTSTSALLGRPRFFFRWSMLSAKPGGYAVGSIGSFTVTKPGVRG